MPKTILIYPVFLFFIFVFFNIEILSGNIENSNDNLNVNFRFESIAFYRTAEVIEITGNEDTFNSIFNFYSNINLLQDLDNGWLYLPELTLNFSIFPQISSKSRFYEYFSHSMFVLRKSGFNIDFIKNKFIFSAHFAYEQNISLNYNFENYNMPIIYNLPTYPLTFSNYTYKDRLPYFPFILGERMLPIYYENAVHYFDTNFYLKFGVDFDSVFFSMYLGGSNGEKGLDSNSAKSFIFKFQILSNNFNENLLYYNLSLSGLIGNRGSVPAKVYSHQYSFYFEIGNYKTKKKYKKNFTIAIEAVLTIHGFTKPYINPYDPSFNNFPQQYESGYYQDPSHITLEWQSFVNLYQYDFGNTYFLPDDLPDIDNYGNPLFGAGGFIYIGFYIIDHLKIFSHFSIYDSNIFSDKISSYKLRYKILSGFKFDFMQNLSFIFSFSYTYDPVFYEFSSQFYDAEDRSKHISIDYDLFLGIRLIL